MPTPVTPILIEAPSAAALQAEGYETRIVLTTPEALSVPEDEDGATQIEAWEPARPAGDGWVLHFKGWVEDDVMAIWAWS